MQQWDARLRTDAHRRAFVLLTQVCRASTIQANAAGYRTNDVNGAATTTLRPPVVVGGAVLDLLAEPSTSADVHRGGSVPGRVTQACGGVGRNICESLALLLRGVAQPLLVTVIGDDAAGRTIASHWRLLGLPLRAVTTCNDAPTPTVCTIFDRDGEVAAQVADVSTIERCLTPDVLRRFQSDITAAPMVVVDANLASPAIEALCQLAWNARVPVWFEPVSAPKSVRATKVMHLLDFVSPNALELVEMANALRLQQNQPLLPQPDTAIGGNWRAALTPLLPFAAAVLEGGAKYVVLSLGARGAALLVRHPTAGEPAAFFLHALPARVAHTSGAGDCLVAGAVAALCRGADPLEALAHGVVAAWLAVQSPHNVPADLTKVAVSAHVQRVMDSLETLN